MTLAQDFAAACQRGAAASPGLHMVGDRLAVGAADVMGADGGGLVVFDEVGLAVPIGSSSGQAALAEQLQFTVGQGPGYDVRGGGAIVATEAVMASRWPALYDLLRTQTSFRSVVVLPLTGPLQSMATIALLFHHPHAAAEVPAAEIAVLCRLITADLIEADLLADDMDAARGAAGTAGPVWLSSPGSVARYQVMTAAGLLASHLHLPAEAALKLLKARAYAERSTADDVAAALVTGRASVATFNLDG